MSRTTMDVDDEACRAVMDRHDLSSKEDAVNYALRLAAGEVSGLDEAREARGSGWDGELAEIRSSQDL